MKILLADSNWKMRGGQWQTLYLAEGLRERGHKVVLLVRHGSLLWELAQRSGLETREIGLTTMLALSGRQDVVHVQDAHAHTLAALASRRPFLVSRRVAFAVRPGWFSTKKYQKARGYLAVSETVGRELRRAGIAGDKIRIVYDGVPDIAPSSYSRTIRGLKSDDPGKLNSLMEEACGLAGLELGLHENLGEALKDGLAFLYLSESEGLGSAVLLAMAAGMPIIASRTGGLVETVDEGFSGLLVSNEKKAVAAALAALRDDRQLSLRFSENARRRYLSKFTLDQMVEKTLEAYREFENG
jgi:hypothetical protein